MFPPTFNRLLDLSVFPLDLVHRFVLLLLLFFLSFLNLLLLPLLCLVLAGVLCGNREVGLSSPWQNYIVMTDDPTNTHLNV